MRRNSEGRPTTRAALQACPSALKNYDVRVAPPATALVVVAVQFDLRNLLVVNPHQVDEDALADGAEEYLKGHAQAAMQSLINRCVRVLFRRFFYRVGRGLRFFSGGAVVNSTTYIILLFTIHVKGSFFW